MTGSKSPNDLHIFLDIKNKLKKKVNTILCLVGENSIAIALKHKRK